VKTQKDGLRGGERHHDQHARLQRARGCAPVEKKEKTLPKNSAPKKSQKYKIDSLMRENASLAKHGGACIIGGGMGENQRGNTQPKKGKAIQAQVIKPD